MLNYHKIIEKFNHKFHENKGDYIFQFNKKLLFDRLIENKTEYSNII